MPHEKRQVTSRLTPYNWTYVETVDVEGQTVSVPRRCMHCTNPPCMNICPFSAIEHHPEGPVQIHDDACMGGAMFKCDGCIDLLKQGAPPACAASCPKGAVTFGPLEEMKALAHTRTAEVGGHIYGEDENGGTSTFYVSKVPFDKIHKAIAQAKTKAGDDKPGRPGMPTGVENYLDTPNGLALSMLVAPVAGIAAAVIGAARVMKKGGDQS